MEHAYLHDNYVDTAQKITAFIIYVFGRFFILRNAMYLCICISLADCTYLIVVEEIYTRTNVRNNKKLS